MKNDITAEDFCSFHKIEITFLHNLDEYGLIKLWRSGDDYYIAEEQLTVLERIVRMHVDLGLNIEGIDTVLQLLEREEHLEQEILTLRNRLRLYEDL